MFTSKRAWCVDEKTICNMGGANMHRVRIVSLRRHYLQSRNGVRWKRGTEKETQVSSENEARILPTVSSIPSQLLILVALLMFFICVARFGTEPLDSIKDSAASDRQTEPEEVLVSR